MSENFLHGKKYNMLRDYCLSLPGTSEDIKWEHNLCFCVMSKIFIMVSLDEQPPHVSFKTSDENFYELQEVEGFRPAPYLARNKWLTLDDINRLNEKKIKEIVNLSYELIKSKLSKKIIAELKVNSGMSSN